MCIRDRLNTVLQNYGGAQGDMLIACATIVQSYMQIVTLPMGGITSGTQPILSFNYGAKNTDRILSLIHIWSEAVCGVIGHNRALIFRIGLF